VLDKLPNSMVSGRPPWAGPLTMLFGSAVDGLPSEI
jgi:hypothetical protein